MYSLYIDTHDKLVCVVLFKDGKLFNKSVLETTNQHSVVTLPTIKKVIEEANINVNDLNEIIVVNGPGSFTGERIAVTIAKTMAYGLNIKIKTIDYLKVLAINSENNIKYTAIIDRNGAFIGVFDKNNVSLEDYKYLNKKDYLDFSKDKDVITDIDIDYDKVYLYIKNNIEYSNVHSVNPLYVKGISALNDKKN